MRYVKLIVLSFLLVQNYWLQAQVLETSSWHDGEVYLSDGEIIKGKLTYNLENEHILIEKEGKIKTFNARQVEFFEFLDNRLSIIRSFYALPYASKGDYEVPMFFELLKYTDDICLLSREYKVHRSGLHNSQQTYYLADTPDDRMVIAEDYFVWNQDRKLHPVGGDNDTLLFHMNDKASLIGDYIKENDLSLTRRPDMLRIFFYYEKLNQPNKI